MQFLDKEAELKKLKILKELEMAKAERDAMKAVEDEENAKVSSLPPDVNRELKQWTFSGRRRPDWHREVGTDVTVASRQNQILKR